MRLHCSDENKNKIKSWDQDQDQTKPRPRLQDLRQCDKLQQVIQFKLCESVAKILRRKGHRKTEKIIRPNRKQVAARPR